MKRNKKRELRHSNADKGKKPAQKFKEHFKRRFDKPHKDKVSARPARAVPERVVGVVVKAHYGLGVKSTDRREKAEYVISDKCLGDDSRKKGTLFRQKSESSINTVNAVKEHLPRGHSPLDSRLRGNDSTVVSDVHIGELVVAEVLASSKMGRREVKVTHFLGQPDDARNVSLIAIHTHQIPDKFSDAALREADAAKPVSLNNRTDLRDIPFVTIDGADARDFDDAVFAEKDKNGWHIIVAIADVAHYVRHGSALDKTAYERGNSTYFPDRVVPMLPEALSNELCSLKPNVDRACMAVHMWLDKAGELTRWQFVRGVMKSRARLAYEQVQAAKDGKADSATAPLLEKIIKPLYAAYDCLMQARLKRGTLELDLPERKVELGKDGFVKSIKTRERLDSHKLIEEFMIAANVAAAAQLEGKGGLCLYRIHDKPNEIKLTALRDFLESIGISLVPAKQLHPRMLTQILESAAGGPHAQVVNEVMLRSQAQAIYSPENIGHFGLALAKYAHFTSPIRRYSDLVVHRGLIRACKLGDDGLSDGEAENLVKIGEHISETERRSATAEREVIDRFTTLFLADKVGAIFPARISGVARFGLFARLDETGADGIIPFNSLPNDYYNYDEKRQAMVGQHSGRVYQLATKVKVRLENADKLTGSMSFAIVEDGSNDKNKQRDKKLGFRKSLKRHR